MVKGEFVRFTAMESLENNQRSFQRDEFTYTSGAILETAIATMEGYFEMIAADGELFKAKIPIFTLLNPGALH